MLAWLFERKIFSSTFLCKKNQKKKPKKKKKKQNKKKKKKKKTKQNKKKKKKKKHFFKKWILKCIPIENLAMQHFIFTASIKYQFNYTTFLTAEDKQIFLFCAV